MAEEASRPAVAASPLTRGFLVNVNLVFLSTVVGYVLAFLIVVVVARALGPDGRGVTSLYQSAVNLGFAFLSLGSGTAAIYFVGRRELTPREAVECGLSVTLFATATTALAVLLLALTMGDRILARGVPYWLALVALPAVVQFRALEAVLRAQGRFLAMNSLELLVPLTALTGLLALDFGVGLTIARSVYVWSLAFVLPVALGYVLVGRDAWPRRLPSRRLLWPTVRFGVQGQLSNLVQLLNYRLDSYLVLFFVSAAGVGQYAVGVSLSEGMWFIANSVAIVLLTDLTAGDQTQAGRLTPLVCRNTLLVTALAALAGAVVAPLAVPLLFGRAFDSAVLPFVLLLPGTVALAATKILAAYVFSRGKPLINGWIAGVTLAVTLAIDLPLIPAFGVPGAAAGASLAYCVSLALTAVAYRSLSGASIAEALLPRAADAALYRDSLRVLTARLRR